MNEVSTVAPGGALASSVPASPIDSGGMLRIIADAAQNPAVDVVKMQALLDMQERILAKQAEAAFNGALARLSAHMPRVKKNGRVDLGKGGGGYDFARWEDMDAVIRPLMRQEGFTMSFDMEERQGGGAMVKGTLLHEEGHSRSASIPLALDTGAGRNNLQAMGSTLSYGKRYCAEMLLNIVREGVDDDGRVGGGEFITADEAEKIEARLRALGANREAFLANLRAPDVASIKAADHAKANNMLASKQRKLDEARQQQ